MINKNNYIIKKVHHKIRWYKMINIINYIITKVHHNFYKKIKILFLITSVTKIYQKVGNLNNQELKNRIVKILKKNDKIIN